MCCCYFPAPKEQLGCLKGGPRAGKSSDLKSLSKWHAHSSWLGHYLGAKIWFWKKGGALVALWTKIISFLALDNSALPESTVSKNLQYFAQFVIITNLVFVHRFKLYGVRCGLKICPHKIESLIFLLAPRELGVFLVPSFVQSWWSELFFVVESQGLV